MKIVCSLLFTLFLLLHAIYAQDIGELTTKRILTLPSTGRTRFIIHDLPADGLYYLRAINQNENPVVFYVYETNPFQLIASNNKNEDYEETLTLRLSKNKEYQVIFSPLRPIKDSLRFSLVRSSTSEAFQDLPSSDTNHSISSANQSIISLPITTFHTDYPIYAYSTTQNKGTLYISYQEKVRGPIKVSRFEKGIWEKVGDIASGNEDKISSFKIAVSEKGKIYLTFLSSPSRKNSKINVFTHNGYNWLDVSPTVWGEIGEVFDFKIKDSLLSLVYAIPIEKNSYTLQVLTNKGIGREWLSLAPLEINEKVDLKGLTISHSPEITLAYNSLSGRDILTKIITYKDSQWIDMEAPAQMNSSYHNLIFNGQILMLSEITNKGKPSLSIYENKLWRSIALDYQMKNPTSFSSDSSFNGALFLAINSSKDFSVIASLDQKRWQFVGSRPYSKASYCEFVSNTRNDETILSYQRGKDIVFEKIEIRN